MMQAPTFTLSQRGKVVTVDRWVTRTLINDSALRLARCLVGDYIVASGPYGPGCRLRFNCTNGWAEYEVVGRDPTRAAEWRMELRQSGGEAPVVPAEESED